MKIIDNLSKGINFSSSILCIIAIITAIVMWSDKSSIQWALDDLTLRDIQIEVVDRNGEYIEAVSFAIEPRYSFDEIKPKSVLTIIGKGSARLSISFVRHFIIRINAPGYNSHEYQYNEDEPSDLRITLEQN